MDQVKREYLGHWLYKANEDVQVFEELLSKEPEHYTGAICFHAQQAVEKFLKSFLIYHDAEFRKVHDLDYLLAECKKREGRAFESIDLRSLTDYGVSIRYADDFVIPSIDDTKYYCGVALEIKRIVDDRIKL